MHGRDDERRVRGDEPELLVPNGLEQVALPPLDVLDAVQRRVEPGEAERARRSGRCRRRARCGAPRGTPGRRSRCRGRGLASTGLRTVSAASVRVAGPIWRTWSARDRRADPSDASTSPSNGSQREPCAHDAVANGEEARSRRARAGRPAPSAAAAIASGRLSRARKRRTSTERGSSASGRKPERREPLGESEAAVVADEPVDAAPRRSRHAPGARGASRASRLRVGSVLSTTSLSSGRTPFGVLLISTAAHLVGVLVLQLEVFLRVVLGLLRRSSCSSQLARRSRLTPPSWTPSERTSAFRARAAGSRGRSRGPAAPSARRACPTRRSGRARAR